MLPRLWLLVSTLISLAALIGCNSVNLVGEVGGQRVYGVRSEAILSPSALLFVWTTEDDQGVERVTKVHNPMGQDGIAGAWGSSAIQAVGLAWAAHELDYEGDSTTVEASGGSSDATGGAGGSATAEGIGGGAEAVAKGGKAKAESKVELKIKSKAKAESKSKSKKKYKHGDD